MVLTVEDERRVSISNSHFTNEVKGDEVTSQVPYG